VTVLPLTFENGYDDQGTSSGTSPLRHERSSILIKIFCRFQQFLFSPVWNDVNTKAENRINDANQYFAPWHNPGWGLVCTLFNLFWLQSWRFRGICINETKFIYLVTNIGRKYEYQRNRYSGRTHFLLIYFPQ
jgi:hypothetical protein